MKTWPYDITKLLSWLFFRAGYGLDVRGQEHVPRDGACLVASNHVSFLDPLVVGVACPRRLTFMARSTLFAHPLLAAWLRGVGAISLRRGEADPSAVRTAIQLLRQGKPMALFPEGGRQVSGVLGAAKRGVGLLALLAQVPIVPVYVQGTFQVLPPSAHRLHRAKIRVAFGPPIPYTTSSLPSTDLSKRQIYGQEEGDTSSRRRQEQLADAVTQGWRRLEEEVHTWS